MVQKWSFNVLRHRMEANIPEVVVVVNAESSLVEAVMGLRTPKRFIAWCRVSKHPFLSVNHRMCGWKNAANSIQGGQFQS